MIPTYTSQSIEVQKILKITYGIVPIVAGADKFANLLTQWSDYLSGGLVNVFSISPVILMCIVGVIEIIAGILVFLKPKIGAYIVMSWLILIALELIITGRFLDVAVRDFVMAIGAFCLAKISTKNR